MQQDLLFRLFGFDKRSMSVSKEVVGGITSFLTMAYILAVNPAILSAAGMDKGAIFTASALASVVATLVMSLYAKMPFVLAPGMGLNAFFAYTVVLLMGYSWQFALTAVLLEGLIFIVLSATGARSLLVKSLPHSLRLAITPSIGLFIAFVGLQNAGLVVSNESTMVALGDFSDTGVQLAIIGFILCGMLMVRKITGGLLIGMLLTAMISILMGITHLDGFFNIPPSIAPICMQFEWHHIFTSDMAVCVLTLLFMDLFDTIGTLVGVCHKAKMENSDGTIPNLNKAFMADAVGTTVGAMLGTSTVTTFVESASGVEVGGRSGLTSFVASICFLLALFLGPLFLSIPPQATAVVLIMVGLSMTAEISKLDLSEPSDYIPCAICLVMMPLTYSISNGIMLSVIAYTLVRLLSGQYRKVSLLLYILTVLFVLKFAFLQ